MPDGIGPETCAVLDNVKGCRASVGATISDFANTTVWLRDRDDLPAFNALYAEYVA